MADDRILEEELASFRREWRAEIQRTSNDSGSSRNSPTTESTSQQSREGSPSPLLLAAKKNSVNNVTQQLEEQATQLFLQGVSAERSGNLYEAIYFYRQAVQLVPDIEFRIEDFNNPNVTSDNDEGDEEADISQEPHDMPYLTDLANRFNSLSVTGICQPYYETRMTHISVISTGTHHVYF
ncbi:F-box only protein 9 [Desmophyllum pertusum]|uniref:F-box only protein 9 n=1 Tax=Desmophyllum pertusum TaxID=174260 RepID=A0A9X0D2K3_9CNID|nr:F-box only protein 9 [Desmophyllum pertusum]